MPKALETVQLLDTEKFWMRLSTSNWLDAPRIQPSFNSSPNS